MCIEYMNMTIIEIEIYKGDTNSCYFCWTISLYSFHGTSYDKFYRIS